MHARVATIALGLGGLIYAANRPGHLLAARLIPLPHLDIPLLRAPWIRNHGADALFAIAVGAALGWWAARHGISVRVTAAIGVVFLVALECVGTTFDPIDIVVELAALALTLGLFSGRVRALGVRSLLFRRAPGRL